jgi:hypothetical protein
VRLRIAAVLVAAITVWVGWAVFIYRPAPNALPPCRSNGALSCSTVDGFPLGEYIQDCDGEPGECGANAKLALDSLPPWESLHPAVVYSAEYALDMARFCGPVVCSMSGYAIYVFDFADGTRHAIGIVCAGVSPTCQAVQTYTSGYGS